MNDILRIKRVLPRFDFQPSSSCDWEAEYIAAKATVKQDAGLHYDHELAMMKASIPLLKPDKAPIGSMQAAHWASLQQLLLDGGFLKEPLDLGKAYSTQFLECGFFWT